MRRRDMARMLVDCPDCGQEIQIDDRWKSARCRHCGVEFDIERESEDHALPREAAAPAAVPSGSRARPANAATPFSRKAPASTSPRARVQEPPPDSAPTSAGQPQTKKPPSKGEAILVIVVCLVVAVFVFGRVFREVKPKPESPPQPAPSRPATPSLQVNAVKQISGNDWVGCTDRADFEKLVQYAVQRDVQAYGQAVGNGLLNGTCTRFADGETVRICDLTVFSGLVKVRREGDLKEYWTNREAVK
jgi:predicted RNA-binding Zn-ribbon protein involved in translation (DUF1610 family)